MLIVIARHWKVFFEKLYLSNIEHDVTLRQNAVFITFAPECLS